jgi:hypothetical protein
MEKKDGGPGKQVPGYSTWYLYKNSSSSTPGTTTTNNFLKIQKKSSATLELLFCTVD